MIANKKQIYKLAGVVLTCAVISACSGTDVSNPPPLNSGTASSGNADFTKYVAIGDSLTAGYADGTLYRLGQTNSLPNILAQQFAAADGVAVDFTQPLVADDLGGLIAGGGIMPHPVSGDNLFKNRFVLNTNPDPDVEGENPSPERLVGNSVNEITSVQTGPFNNMGVPGAKIYHLFSGTYGDATQVGAAANPYFVRFASSASTTLLTDVVTQTPSFYTLWIGNNDTLSFAASGGYDDFQQVNAVDRKGDQNAAGYGRNDITDPTLFATLYGNIVGALKQQNPDVQGVLINLPDVKSIPYFTTIPYNAIPLDQETADTLNVNYAQYNAALSNPAFNLPADEIAKRTIGFSAGQNAIVIEDETLTDLTVYGLASMRQATADDLILLPAGGYIGKEEKNVLGVLPPTGRPWGVGWPLHDADVLIPSEIKAIDDARTAFNATIKAVADGDNNLLLLDVAALMQELKESGIDFGTGSVRADFVTGGGFSLDGVHPTARGYAVIANEIISVINAGFGANVHKVDPVAYPTIFVK